MGIKAVFKENRELIVITICILAFFVLIVLYNFDYQAFKDKKDKSFTLNFDGSLIFSNDNIALTVENNNGSVKTIRISGIGNGVETRIYTTLLIGEKNENTVSSDKIKLNHTDNDLLVTTNNLVTGVDFSIEDIPIGSYEGWLVILNGNNINYVPLLTSTEVRIWQAIMVILCGVFVAIAFWEVLRLFSRTNLKEIGTKLMKSNFVITSPALKWVKLDNRLKSATMVTRIAVVDLSIILGVIISMIALLSNGFVTSIVDIDMQTLAILFGMGLGIGSLNKLADRT